MPTNRLTDQQCKSAKPGDKPVKMFDGHGLFLLVTPTGSKLWRMAYRQGGKPQTATFGPYPLVTLAEAREKRDAARKSLLNGEPVGRKPKPSPALKDAAHQYWNGRGDITEGYRKNVLAGIDQHLAPLLGDRPLNTIKRADLMEAFERMAKAGILVYMRRVRTWIKPVFSWGMQHGHCETNPAADIDPKDAFKRPAKPVNHAALPLHEVHGFIERISLDGDLKSVLMCKFLALTWTRTTETRGMKWSEVVGAVWTIPPERMKRKVSHEVYLSRQAVDILRKMRERRRGNEYVFEADHRQDRALSENAVLALIARAGYKGRMTGHGWRTVASTWANEQQCNPDAVERQLNHVPEDEVRGRYNQAKYKPARVEMLQRFADWLLPDDVSLGRKRLVRDGDAAGAQG